MKKLILVVVCLLFVNTAKAVERSEFSMARRNVAGVMLFGLGGAVLGLSTLSFYGKPEEHIGNIYLGLAAGLIGGTVFVLTNSETERSFARDEFSRPAQIPTARSSTPTVLNWAWDF